MQYNMQMQHTQDSFGIKRTRSVNAIETGILINVVNAQNHSVEVTSGPTGAVEVFTMLVTTTWTEVTSFFFFFYEQKGKSFVEITVLII